MTTETFDKLLAGIVMALRAALLETVDSGQRTDLTTQLPVEAAGVACQKAAAESITDARRINDFVFRYGRDVDSVGPGIEVSPVFTAGDHQRLDMIQYLVQAPTGLLRDQTKFIVVTE